MSHITKTHIITVEGNIGSGKSTLLSILEEYYKTNSRICILQEPINQWNSITDENDKTILEKYYEDQKKYAFSFQTMASLSRYTQLRNALNKGYDIIITERCIYSDYNIFTKMLYDNKMIEELEYKIYMQHFTEFTYNLPELSIIYIRTDPSVSYERVIKRNRQGENISIDYLSECHKYHEQWLNNIMNNILYINGNIDIISNKKELNTLITNINSFMNIPCYINNSERYLLQFDGGSRGNPGVCGCGYVILNSDSIIIAEGYEFLSEKNTNNYAEYMGVIYGLKKAIELNIKNIDIRGDSMIVVKQVLKEFACNAIHLKSLLNNVNLLLDKFDNYTIDYITRDENKYADMLANKGMDIYNSKNNDMELE